MARLSRIIAVGYPHHITQGGVRSLDIFQSDEDRRSYLQYVKEETERFEVEILAWCLMTNHVHFIDAKDRQSEALRLATRTGRPAGDLSFIESLEKMIGRTFQQGKLGRPVKSKL